MMDTARRWAGHHFDAVLFDRRAANAALEPMTANGWERKQLLCHCARQPANQTVTVFDKQRLIPAFGIPQSLAQRAYVCDGGEIYLRMWQSLLVTSKHSRLQEV
jgi:hypothetical protein